MSQKKDDPSEKDRSKTQALLSEIEMSCICPLARQAAARAYPSHLLGDFAGTVIDDEIVELLGYR